VVEMDCAMVVTFSLTILLFTIFFCNPLPASETDRWAIGTGCAVISAKNTNAAVLGDSAGRVYNLNLNYILKEMDFSIGAKNFFPRLELFSSLGWLMKKAGLPF